MEKNNISQQETHPAGQENPKKPNRDCIGMCVSKADMGKITLSANRIPCHKPYLFHEHAMVVQW